ncbi:hypothetical protein Q3G72_005176 [Acer saccharum]|nr:hypothetical protein Q3G72_005176 [Acer saccharum]
MEDYFNPFDHIEKAYQTGHLVLMELIDRAMLKMQENNIVVVEGAALNMIDTSPHGFGRGFHVRTQVLGVFNSRHKPLISSLSSLKDLDALVLRNCNLLDDTTHISNLTTLRVLEISESRAGEYSSLMSILENLFDEMTQLQTLNLSVSDTPKLAKINHESFQHLTYLRYLNFLNPKVENLPTLSNLRNLRQVLLRNCSLLRNLPAMKGVTRLEELDLSSCSALQVNESIIDSFRINM